MSLFSGMDLFLLRHGIAEEAGPGQSDWQRALTEEGRRKLRQVLQAASEAKVSPSLILTSPLRRTIETAELAREVLKSKAELVRCAALQPGTTVEKVWDEIRLYKDEPELLVVGHNPTFSDLAGYLLGSPTLQVDFKKGALMKIEIPSFSAAPRGALQWYLTAKLASHRD
jgi:phosphohistidine phosphatase